MMIKKTIERRTYSYFEHALKDLKALNEVGFGVELTAIDREATGYGINIYYYWEVHVFKWCEKILVHKDTMEELEKRANERGFSFSNLGIEVVDDGEDESKDTWESIVNAGIECLRKQKSKESE